MFIGGVCEKLWKHVEVCSHLAGVLRNRTWYNVIIENVRIQMWLKPRFSPYQLGEGHVRNGYNPAWPTGKMAHLENCDIQPDMPHVPWIFWEKCHPAWKKKTSHPSNFHAAKVLLGRELNILQACGSVDQLEATLKYQNLAAKMAQRNQRKGMKLG